MKTLVLIAALAFPAAAQLRTVPVRVAAPAAPVSVSQLSVGSLFDGAPGASLDMGSLVGASIAEVRAEFQAAPRPVAAKKARKVKKARKPTIIATAREMFGDAPIVSRNPKHRAALAAPEDGELSDEVKRSPRTNLARQQAVVELFQQAGAAPGDIQLQDIGRGASNIIVTKKGESDRVIVVGAHYDKVSAGEGTIDNWTGAAMVTNLYQALKDLKTQHTIIFIAFGREEEGLVGSNKYVQALPREQVSKIDSMVNLDTLGVDGTFSWKNNSDAGMLRMFREAAQRETLDLTERILRGGDSDSSSFRRVGVPAMTLFGCSPERIFDIIHSEKDTFASFNLAHYRNSYKLTLAVVKALDGVGRPSPFGEPTARK